MNDLLLGFVLGVIQGLTEFLPVSSSAHLLFPSLIFGSNDLGLAFDIVVHAGTLCAVIFFFKKEIISMIKSFFKNNTNLKEDKRLALLLIAATLPIVIFGYLGSDLIQNNRSNISSIAWMNLIFAALLLVAYKLYSNNKNLIQLTLVGALCIGFFQIFSLLPGASRSGTAITAALFVGLNLKDASKFSFMLAIPTILGAMIFLIGDFFTSDISINLSVLLIGFFSSLIFAFLTIKYFLAFVEQIGMYPFVFYRVALGITLLLLI